jgi:hypothetical protein
VGQRWHCKSKGLYFSMETETKIISLEQEFLYTTKQYQQLRE